MWVGTTSQVLPLAFVIERTPTDASVGLGANYQAYQADSGWLVVQAPDLLLTPEAAADSAGWFWHKAGLNTLADNADIGAITKRVNGGQTGLLERSRATQQAPKALA
jgi:putative chitinase